MGKTIYPAGRLCQCGCGLPTARATDREGRNKGYRKYAKGHQPPATLTNPAAVAKAHAAKNTKVLLRLPIGSRRVRTIYGKQYWEIKVRETGRCWMYEHRHIMEQRLGRTLLKSEHVHHRDDNGLNNGLHADGQENLELLSKGEHSSQTNKNARRAMCKCVCRRCGARLKHFKRLTRRKRK